MKVFFVDSGTEAEKSVESLRELPPEFLADPVRCHPAIVGLVKPAKSATSFQFHIAQKLANLDGETVKIRILRWGRFSDGRCMPAVVWSLEPRL